MNDGTVPLDATAARAEAVVRAAIAWRHDNDGEGLMTREEWELWKAMNEYGDKYVGLRGQ